MESAWIRSWCLSWISMPMLPLSRLHLLAQVVQQLYINPVTVVSDVVSGPFGAFVQATTCCPPASWQICGPVSVPGPVCRSTKLLAPHVCKPKTVKESMGESHVSCKEGIQTSAGQELHWQRLWPKPDSSPSSWVSQYKLIWLAWSKTGIKYHLSKCVLIDCEYVSK